MIANDQEVLSIGDIVEIYDKISDDELLTTATVKYIEVEVTDGTDAADDVRVALEKFMELFGLDSSKRDSRSWMEIINGGAE